MSPIGAPKPRLGRQLDFLEHIDKEVFKQIFTLDALTFNWCEVPWTIQSNFSLRREF